MFAARRRVRLRDFLTDAEMIDAIHIKQEFKASAAKVICERIVQPNLRRINDTLGQDNDAMYLAYMIEAALEDVII